MLNIFQFLFYYVKRYNLFSEEFINQIYNESIIKLNSFFQFEWKHYKPIIFILPNRKAFDELENRKTNDWEVAKAEGRFIFTLSIENYESESSHKYSLEKYKASIIHELVHNYTFQLTKNNFEPFWIIEGIAIYLSNQISFNKKPKN